MVRRNFAVYDHAFSQDYVVWGNAGACLMPEYERGVPRSLDMCSAMVTRLSSHNYLQIDRERVSYARSTPMAQGAILAP